MKHFKAGILSAEESARMQYKMRFPLWSIASDLQKDYDLATDEVEELLSEISGTSYVYKDPNDHPLVSLIGAILALCVVAPCAAFVVLAAYSMIVSRTWNTSILAIIAMPLLFIWFFGYIFLVCVRRLLGKEGFYMYRDSQGKFVYPAKRPGSAARQNAGR